SRNASRCNCCKAIALCNSPRQQDSEVASGPSKTSNVPVSPLLLAEPWNYRHKTFRITFRRLKSIPEFSMGRITTRTILFCRALTSANGRTLTANSQDPKSAPGGPFSGRWIVSADYLGTPLTMTMKLTQQADKLTGDLDGDKLEGSFTGYSIHFLAKGDQGGSEEGTATVQGDSMYGTIIYVDVSNP